jgi:hypothetical protein
VARFSGDGLAEPDGSEPLGHRVYPLLDTESTTDPVPVYKPEDDAARKTKPAPRKTDPDKKKWWPF